MFPSARSNKLIAFVSNSAWSVYNFRLDVICHLIRLGFNVLVFAPDDEYSGWLVQNGCRFVPINFDNQAENPWRDFQFYRQLKKYYSHYKPDFIFHYVVKPNIYGSLA